MTLDTRLALATQNALVDAWVALLGGGSLEIYTAPRPANAATPPGAATRLSTHALSAPFAPSGSGGQATSTGVADAPAVASGAAEWARFKSSDGSTVMDVSVGVGSGFNINVTTTAFILGALIRVTSYTLTVPALLPG